MKMASGYCGGRIKRITAAVMALVISLLCLSAGGCDGGEKLQPGKKETTVFIATDIHLFSDNLVGKDNQRYLKDKFATDGRIQECDYQLVEALVDRVNEEKPEFLILTGDLTFNGERDSHLELARLLRGILDTKVLLIPGNHDVYSLGAVSVLNDEITPTESITEEDFRNIYADFGYGDGLYYDEGTLSYIYPLAEDKWALMLDTSLSRYNEEYDASLVGGGIEDGTLLWLEEKLSYAKEKGISVISFTHHNLLIHNELFADNYTLRNAEQLLDLYAKYDVSLNFSGHLHIQSIKQTEHEGKLIHDVCGGSLLDYGNRYGRLDIYDNCYSYSSLPLELSEEVREHSFDVFYRKYYNKTLWTYQGKLGAEGAKEAVDLLARINTYYFDGSYTEIHRLLRENRGTLRKIKKNTQSYDSSYVRSIIEVEKKDQHSLLIER